MLSTTLHQYTPAFSHLPSPTLMSHEQHLSQQHMSAAGLDQLAQSSQYALQQLHSGRQTIPTAGKSFLKSRQHPYANGPMATAPRSQAERMAHERAGRNAGTAPVRRRISRACDQCNQLRTKCDGKAPCAHCVEFGLTCEYVRERKKRGKASRKDIAQQQAAVAAAAAASEGAQASPKPGSGFSSEDQGTPSSNSQSRDYEGRRPIPEVNASNAQSQRSMSLDSNRSIGGNAMYPGVTSMPRSMTLGNSDVLPTNGNQDMSSTADGMNGSMQASHLSGNALHDRNAQMMSIPDFNSMEDYQRSLMQQSQSNGHQSLHNSSGMIPHPIIPSNNLQGYGDSPYTMLSPQAQQPPPNAFRLNAGESPLSGFLGSSPVGGSPGWLSISSPSGAIYGQASTLQSNQGLRYPVLAPLIPRLGNIIPVSLACDLLELYFQSSSSAFMRPLSPYVLGYVFRKRSFLRQTNPRICSPALLASMIWIGAQTHESAILTSPPSARGKICQKLMELTVGLLRPLIHTPASNEGSPIQAASTVINGVALGGFGVALPGNPQATDQGNPGATGALDDIATYCHLATVVSASEYKAASLRWWNAAWSLARELKLGRELPPNPENPYQNGRADEDRDADGEVDVDIDMSNGNSQVANGRANEMVTGAQQAGFVSEEEREERRRIWWLLYTMDRHLALCYNRPLFLLDIECDGLLQPMDDSIWQSGEYLDEAAARRSADPASSPYRQRGPAFECTGHSIFGYFLPLMTILGEIVDLNHARNHPRFGLRFRSGSDWDDQALEITQQLEAYGRSLKEFENRCTSSLSENNGESNGAENHLDASTPSVHSVSSSSSRITESIIQTKIAIAYGTHLMHTLHILLNGKWDPISLLDDNDLWISSQSFITATGHAVSAAEAIDEILDNDPDLSFMPFFFGIYLLQGSFLLLLIADKLQGEASSSVVKACESIVRAHEACVVTLNTEYQAKIIGLTS